MREIRKMSPADRFCILLTEYEICKRTSLTFSELCTICGVKVQELDAELRVEYGMSGEEMTEFFRRGLTLSEIRK